MKFICNYLENRKQLVVIDREVSETLPVLSGIPQGSILGPLLFVLFINDINSVINDKTNIYLYADDTKIWREISTYEDHLILQDDINALHKWSMDNIMKFHHNKCKALQVTSKLEQYMHALPFSRFPYYLDDQTLDYVSSEKDLGVVVQSKLLWNEHCVILTKQANQRLGLLRRTLYFTKNVQKRRVFYISLVRSIFEHCSSVWKPCSTTIEAKMEKLQKRAVKWILASSLVITHKFIIIIN